MKYLRGQNHPVSLTSASGLIRFCFSKKQIKTNNVYILPSVGTIWNSPTLENFLPFKLQTMTNRSKYTGFELFSQGFLILCKLQCLAGASFEALALAVNVDLPLLTIIFYKGFSMSLQNRLKVSKPTTFSLVSVFVPCGNNSLVLPCTVTSKYKWPSLLHHPGSNSVCSLSGSRNYQPLQEPHRRWGRSHLELPACHPKHDHLILWRTTTVIYWNCEIYFWSEYRCSQWAYFWTLPLLPQANDSPGPLVSKDVKGAWL